MGVFFGTDERELVWKGKERKKKILHISGKKKR